MPRSEILTPPNYCQSAAGPCDQSFDGLKVARGVFLYASAPNEIAKTVEGAVTLLKYHHATSVWKTWREFGVPSQIIFTQICKAIRFADVVFADVTTLNFNVLFEIGFALGLEQPIVPIRDTSWTKHKSEFEQLGILDTIGFLDFQNADQLSRQVYEKWQEFKAIPTPKTQLNLNQPVFIVKGHLTTDGEIRLISSIKKSELRFRTFDVLETPRLSLFEARKQVASSIGVVAHLLNPSREGSLVHNARCALIAGMATAAEKIVLLVSEGAWAQPIDYRDIVFSYASIDQLSRATEPFIRAVFGRVQDAHLATTPRPERFLERLNLGAVAAENEIGALKGYFVKTAQFNDARRGTARLLTGRKGSGKTAIFYAVRNAATRGNAALVLDLKPEGYQFTKLRDAVLTQLSAGLQEHTLTAFWEYILLCEIAHKILSVDHTWAQRDERRRKRYEKVVEVYSKQPSADVGDFSERLLRLVEVTIERFESRDRAKQFSGGQITEMLFHGGIRELQEALRPYLQEKDNVSLLFDNIDKGWPTRGAHTADILIVRTLLEATRKLEHQLEQASISFHVLLCLRNDIHELLLREMPDKGKDTAISLDYDDRELFKEIVRQRILFSGVLKAGTFDQLWPQIFPAQVRAQEGFRYLMDRTLMRPRDLLNFLHRATETAINRGHDRVSEEDVLTAEKRYSEDILVEMVFELRDTYPQLESLPYSFIGTAASLSVDTARELVESAGLTGQEPMRVLEVLVWYGFLGIARSGEEDPTFSYEARYNIDKIFAPVRAGAARFVIHPAFRTALGTIG
jgi:hypothetical protein